MKKFLFLLALLPSFLLAQGPPPPCPFVNTTFPVNTDFELNSLTTTPIPGAQPWSFGPNSPSGTPSINTGPTTDVSGVGDFIFTEATGQQPNTWYAFQTECFNVDNDPGMELSFFYHMFGAAMGSLEVFIIEADTLTGDTTEFFTVSGDQGNLWRLALFDLDSMGVSGDFYLQFHGYRGPGFTSDMAIDNIRIGSPLVITYGCTDTLALNYDSLAMINDSSCVYPPCTGIQNLQGSISCFQYLPNQGQVSVSWDAPSNQGCTPTGFYRGTDLNNLTYQPYQIWNGTSFFGYTNSGASAPPNYYFIIETLDGYMDTLVIPNVNCGVGCTDSLATNYNPFAALDNGTCQYGTSTPCGDTINQKIYVTVTPDTYAGETSWEIVSTDTLGILASVSTGYYQTTGVPVTDEYCLPKGSEFTFNLQDSFGDGMCGSCFSGVDGSVVVTDACGDTIFSLLPSQGDNANFGFVTISDPYTLDDCPPVNPDYGCKDPLYLEYNSLATNNDQSMCLTLAIPGCVDSTMFNYDPAANTMDLIPNCDYTLRVFDGGGDGWNGSYIGIVQDGNPIGAFTTNGMMNDYTINVSALTHIEITFYEIFDQQGTSTDITQCGFKLIDPLGNIVYEKGNNPWLNPIQPGVTYTPTLNCGNYCIPRVYGCIDTTAYNFDPNSNTDDGSCVYQPGCTDPLYLEYHTQGFTADVDDGSCSTLAVFGCTDSTAFNYDPLANLDNSGCIPKTFGCTDSTQFNYDVNANTDDGSCIPFIYGCTDASAFNFDSLANTNDGSCIPVVFGCTDSTQFNYDASANTDNGSCIPFIYGCIDSTAFNYNNLANTSDGSCIPVLLGCTDSTAINFNPLANTNDGSCIAELLGCTDPTALNYNSLANTDDGSCIPYIYGCTDSSAFNFDSLANTDDGSCIPFIYGCMDPTMFNYNPNANSADTCIPFIYGCTDPTAWNYDSLANTNVGCISFVYGCTDPAAFNYNPQANTDDSTCVPVVIGCTDPTALNYDSLANTNNGCIYPVPGCTDPTAFNYDPNANVDDSSCVPVIIGCTDPTALNYDSLANTNSGCIYTILGCTDPTMFNYNQNANVDDGSCVPYIYGCTDSTAINYCDTCNTNVGCIYPILGCTDPTMFNYNPNANTDDGSCVPFIYGCTNPLAINYDSLANTDNGSCILPVPGCTDPNAFNYDPLANVDDGSCVPFIYGCTDPTMYNYCDTCNTDNGSCIPFIYGCTDSTQYNYDPTANTDNGSCIPFIYGCTDNTALNFNPLANTLDNSCCYIGGCTDSTAVNYNPLACFDDNSCITPIVGCTDVGAYNYNPAANVSDSASCLYDAGCYGGPGVPFWLNDGCYAWVISVDDYCCTNDWDASCQSMYDYCQLGWPTSVEDISSMGIMVYPNPTGDMINIDTRLDVEVEIYDIMGKLMTRETSKRIDLSDYPNGVYNLILIYKDRKFNTRVVKQ